MLAVMQLKMSPEMADKIRRQLERLRTTTSDPEVLRKLNLNNLIRFYISEGMEAEPPVTDEYILREIVEHGMMRGRPTKDE